MVPVFGHPPTTAPSDARVKRARFAVMGLFASLGILLATFISRSPSVRDQLDVSLSGLALLGMFGAFGALVALLVTGWAASKFGTRALLWWASIGYMVAFSLVAIATEIPSNVIYAAGTFFVSFSFSFSNVAMNAEAAEVERRVGRAIMPQFHAAFSVGSAFGLGLGALISHAEVKPIWHFIGVAAVVTVGRLILAPWAAIDGAPVAGDAAAALGGPFATAKAEYTDPRVVLIGIVVFAAAMTEMTAAQWLPISVHDDFGQRESIGDLVYWVFVLSMVTVRSLGAVIIAKLGRVVTLRVSAVAVMLGLAIYAFTPTMALIPAAVILWGAGAALTVPIGFSAASDEPGRAAARVAAVSSFSTIAGLLVPQIIGKLGDMASLRIAFLVVALGSITLLVLAKAVRRDAPLFGRATSTPEQLPAS